MKQRFFIYIVIILVMLFALCLAVIYGMWFCAVGAGLVSLLCVLMMYRWVVDTRDMLDSERMMQRKAEKALGDAEGQLVYYKMLMEKVDTAVLMATESGHVEWMNSCAEKMVGESCVLSQEVMKAIETNTTNRNLIHLVIINLNINILKIIKTVVKKTLV